MKKFIALALALILTLSMAVVAFAGTIEDLEATDGTTVTGSYVLVTEGADDVSVAVSWANAAWTYTVTKSWNATDAKYDYAAVWANANQANTTVAVRNQCAFAIDVEVEITEAEALAAYVDVDFAADNAATATALASGATFNTAVTVAAAENAEIYGQDSDNGSTFDVATLTVSIARTEA